MTIEHTSAGDPARSLALLWRTRERSSRKGKPELNVDRIVRAAIDLADSDGLGALSMRRVAERLGVGTMSLYTYVPGKAELIDVMVDTVYAEPASDAASTGETQDTHDTGTGGGWRDRLERVARQNWSLLQRHPWLLQVGTARPVLGPNAIAKYDHELRTVDGIGLTDLEMDAVLTLVAGHVEATARLAVEVGQTARLTDLTDEQWWSAHAPILARMSDASRYPAASRVGQAVGAAYGSVHDPTQAFEFGLQRILDGIQTLVESRSPA
ncbi:TetR/AcrR family transcriptional regulator [Actinopolymorpha alba]|uniref:TetR/AcrR family transcriptional regulator n=1 Tax=Actinopolymorpha alba TaxID=533267 RepID=UPI00039A2329|nr:TetR/AcrR family transcriptional regulator [Actinopolymorpha alba]